MNFENMKNIEMVVELLKEHNIKHLVINPGGTNIPLIKLVQNDNFFNCYSVVDERSAVYFAIGIYLQTGNPVAMICTSAQATRNYIPGLTEAFYKKVPILAITMEKHPRFKYQGYMQAPDQTSLPKDSVKKSFELPFIRDINDVYHSHRAINEAILELSHNGNGPVQLCIPMLDFKIADIEPKNISMKRILINDLDKINLNEKKILIVIGEHRIFSKEEKDALDYFCKNTDTVIYTNHLSNFSNEFSIDANLLLSTISDEKFEKIKPDIIITIGGQTGDYPLYLRLSKTNYSEIENWLISEDGNVVDTYDKLTCIFQGKEKDFFLNICENNIKYHKYYELWKNENEKLTRNIDVPFSNVSIANFLHDKLPENSIIQFSILNSLRVWNLFELNPKIECYSNVGAFGIDGGMSTLIGQSIVTDKLSFMIIGDLAFLYDMNSLGIRHIKNNLRILIINNNGGIEFKLYGEDKKIVDNYIAAANHFKNAKGWAETCGFKYLSAKNMDEFKENSQEFISKSDKPIIFEVFVSDLDESKAYQEIIKINKETTKIEYLKEALKDSIKKSIGNDNFNKLKNKMKRYGESKK